MRWDAMNFLNVDIQLLQQNRTSDKQRVGITLEGLKWC